MGNLVGHHGNISTMIDIAVSSYNTFEGRFFSRIFDMIFNYYRPLWVLVNALGTTFYIILLVKLWEVKKLF